MPTQLPTDDSWPAGEAFAAVLRAIDELWQGERRILQRHGEFRFLLIEQWSSSDGGGDVAGDVERAWVANAEQLHRINDAEHAAHIRHLHTDRPTFFPFVLIQFCVPQDGRKVCFGHRRGSRAGFGGAWVITHDDRGPLLVPNPNADMWIS